MQIVEIRVIPDASSFGNQRGYAVVLSDNKIGKYIFKHYLPDISSCNYSEEKKKWIEENYQGCFREADNHENTFTGTIFIAEVDMRCGSCYYTKYALVQASKIRNFSMHPVHSSSSRMKAIEKLEYLVLENGTLFSNRALALERLNYPQLSQQVSDLIRQVAALSEEVKVLREIVQTKKSD